LEVQWLGGARVQDLHTSARLFFCFRSCPRPALAPDGARSDTLRLPFDMLRNITNVGVRKSAAFPHTQLIAHCKSTDHESGGQEFESLRARQIRRKIKSLSGDGGNRSTRTRSVPVSCPEVQPHPIALWGEQTARHFLYFDDDRNPDLGSDRGVKVGLDLRRLNSNDQRITSDFFPRAKMRTLIPPAHRWIDGDVAS